MRRTVAWRLQQGREPPVTWEKVLRYNLNSLFHTPHLYFLITSCDVCQDWVVTCNVLEHGVVLNGSAFWPFC